MKSRLSLTENKSSPSLSASSANSRSLGPSSLRKDNIFLEVFSCALRPDHTSAAEFLVHKCPMSSIDAVSFQVSPSLGTFGCMRRLFFMHRMPPSSRYIIAWVWRNSTSTDDDVSRNAGPRRLTSRRPFYRQDKTDGQRAAAR